ncbi:MAG: HAMP domain-containing histidine kinase [Gracilibacteraceae bacterium]|jgi:signal transduction histidine kinase|nr:HAMP domain-containing histidine kinase [Gracilibacteraceae bacterium]
MKIKTYAALLALILALGICAVLFLFPVPEDTVDVARINDMIQSGQVIDKSAFADTQQIWRGYRVQLQAGVIAILFLTISAAALFLVVLYRKILRPFETMRGFAQSIASGELDVPLTMDSGNAFGAFTESFDLMRDELRRAKESERAAEQSKRELVASLSHDIQTPVASIKAVAELMEMTAPISERQKLQTIQQKAAQIETLVSELLHTTLEELDSLHVEPVSLQSSELVEIMRKSDYGHRAGLCDLPGCMLRADPARLSQVMDNIFANSYKYADTDIDVSAEADDDGLTITMRDHGPGVAPDELPRLCTKYFRGKGAEGKNGYGLGLFISHAFMERMGGGLICENAAPGFAVKIHLPYDG